MQRGSSVTRLTQWTSITPRAVLLVKCGRGPAASTRRAQEDGTRFAATEIIAGSVTRTIGEVVSVDAGRKELTLKNNEGKTITVAIGDRSLLRRVTPEVAATFATRPGRVTDSQGGPNDRGERRERRERPAGENGEARRGGEGRAGRGGRGLQEMLAGLPAISPSAI